MAAIMFLKILWQEKIINYFFVSDMGPNVELANKT